MILDTSLLIAGEREEFDLTRFVGNLGAEPVAIAAITASELLHGVERAREPQRRSARQRYVEGLLDALPVLAFGLEEARVHARLWASLAAKGRLIGAHDLLVSATAIAAGSSVATLNQKDFKRVPGLNLASISKFMRSRSG